MRVRKTWQPGVGGILAIAPLSMPVCLTVMTPFAPGASTFQLSAHGLVVGRYILWAGVVYLVGFSFLIEWVMRRGSERIRSRGVDPNVLILRSNVASVAVLPAMAFLLCLLGGRSSDVYILALVSLALGTFWCLRMRSAFVSNRV